MKSIRTRLARLEAMSPSKALTVHITHDVVELDGSISETRQWTVEIPELTHRKQRHGRRDD